MSIDRHLQEKIYRLETLRKYQAYYGPNTPNQILAEINQLESEIRRMLKADVTRPTPAAGSPAHSPYLPPKKKARKNAPRRTPKTQAKAAPRQPQPKRKSAAAQPSAFNTETVATLAVVSLVVVLGIIIFLIYLQFRSASAAAQAQSNTRANAVMLRPTFTPTTDPNAPPGAVVQPASANDSLLPPAHKEPTPIPTPVPTLTPSAVPLPTNTPTPPPTNTPAPTNTAPPPPPQPPTATSGPPTPTPGPSFPFSLAERGNREFQRTTYHAITVYVAIVSEGNIPIGGLKVVGDHSPSGAHVESGLSDWNWSVTNCLDCDYIKFGNLKFEPGPFEDGVWSVYVADEQGNQLSEAVPLTYSANPDQWVWDFLIFRKKG
ncbi:MAG: hypothetical protein D6768_00485 [Chloroflexi bacterium]|nr:MAG: hypothetical protein D6768_00485 [Chloroflexota bacterium]